MRNTALALNTFMVLRKFYLGSSGELEGSFQGVTLLWKWLFGLSNFTRTHIHSLKYQLQGFKTSQLEMPVGLMVY